MDRYRDEHTFAGVCVEVMSSYTWHKTFLAGIAHKLLHGRQSGAQQHSTVHERQRVTLGAAGTLTSSPLDLRSPDQ